MAKTNSDSQLFQYESNAKMSLAKTVVQTQI